MPVYSVVRVEGLMPAFLKVRGEDGVGRSLQARLVFTFSVSNTITYILCLLSVDNGVVGQGVRRIICLYGRIEGSNISICGVKSP